jgi:MFS family permease
MAIPLVVRPASFFYGRFILVATLFIELAIGCGHSYGLNAFVDSWINSFDTTRTELSVMFGVAMIISSLMVPAAGWAVDTYGSLAVVATTAIIFSGSILALSFTHSVYAFGVLMCCIRFAGPEAAGLAGRTALNRWYIKYRGSMGAIKSTFENMLLAQPVVFSFAIEHIGWRATYKYLSGFVVATFCVAIVFLRDFPEHYGYTPDDEDDTSKEENKLIEGSEAKGDPADWPFKEAIATPAVRIILFHVCSKE